MKNFTVRLSDEQLILLRKLAILQQTDVSVIIRDLVTTYINLHKKKGTIDDD